MALTGISDLKAKIYTNQVWFHRGTTSKETSRAHSMASLWSTSPENPSTPSTAVACTSSTSGAVSFVNGGAGTLWLTSLDFCTTHDNGATRGSGGGSFILYDRLAHQGGLSGTVTSAQTTNLPTAALTRYTDGVGVMAAVEVYAAIGSTQQTLTVTYTDQDGNASQTTTRRIGSVEYNDTGAFMPIPLGSGDTGFRSVEQVQLGGSTGTTGNFGITLFKPLAVLQITGFNDMHVYEMLQGLFPVEVVDNACLALLNTKQADISSTVSNPFYGSVGFVEA